MAEKDSPRAAKVTKVMEEMVKQGIRCERLHKIFFNTIFWYEKPSTQG